MIIHAGDVSNKGSKSEIEEFLNWYKELNFKHKIFIAGNHDFFFESATDQMIKQIIPKNIIYLNDSGIEIEGIKIRGSQIQPEFFNWAFNRERGAAIKKHWDLIPTDTDILITHGPPYKILDLTTKGTYSGCKELKKKVFSIQPKLHVFGHIHEGYGTTTINKTLFINASLLNEKYQSAHIPIVIDL